MDFRIRKIDHSILEKQDDTPAQYWRQLWILPQEVRYVVQVMTFDCENNETDCFLAAADNVEIVVKMQPRPSSTVLAADKSTKNEASRGKERAALLIFQWWIIHVSNKSRCF